MCRHHAIVSNQWSDSGSILCLQWHSTVPGDQSFKVPLYCHFWNLSWVILRLLRKPPSSAWTYVSVHYDTDRTRTLCGCILGLKICSLATGASLKMCIECKLSSLSLKNASSPIKPATSFVFQITWHITLFIGKPFSPYYNIPSIFSRCRSMLLLAAVSEILKLLVL